MNGDERVVYHRRLMRHASVVIVFLVLGCDPGVVRLIIELRSDLSPGTELARVETDVDGERVDDRDIDAAHPSIFDGVQLAQIDGIAPGLHDIDVRLFDPDGRLLFSRHVVLTLSGSRSITILATRSCLSVECPDGEDPLATQCRGGRCVREDCVSDELDTCGTLACTDASMCAGVSCAGAGACVSGDCAFPDVAACSTGYACDVSIGCAATRSGRPVDAIAVGAQHGCAVSGGELFCWGVNLYGQLGLSTPGSFPPTRVEMPLGVDEVVVGARYTCARSGERVFCFGDNARGQLGRDSTGEGHGAIAAVLGVAADALFAGTSHVCARRSTQSPICWGANESGQAGVGPDPLPPTALVQPSFPVSRIRSLHLGSAHSCALFEGGTVMCWGANGAGELGDGTTTARTSAVSVAGIPVATALAGTIAFDGADTASTCIVGDDGLVHCWGSNDAGQLGTGETGRDGVVRTVAGLTDVQAIVAGSRAFCARRTDDSWWCWGQNNWGELGRGESSEREPMAAPAPELDGMADYDLGFGWGCGIARADGSVSCVGSNDFGQLNGVRDEPPLSLGKLTMYIPE